MPFSYKIHKTGSEVLLAVADSDLVGKTFFDKEKEIEVSKEFYGDKRGDAGTIASMAKEATIVNAMGRNVVDLLIDKGIVQSEETVEVCGIPHAQVFLIRQ